MTDTVIVLASDGTIRTLEEIEADIIRLALKYNYWKRTKTAKALGIGRSTLWHKMKRYGIPEAQQSTE